jgi:hypothetical protein
MEFHEPVSALRAALPECARCAELGHAVRWRLLERDAALDDWRAAWTPRQRTATRKILATAAWWAGATGRQLEWHLFQEHRVVPQTPQWCLSGDDADPWGD